MSLAGLRKQMNKANQYMSEKIGGAKGTELENDFVEMEKHVDILEKLVDDLMIKTQELLQPNPMSRSKMMAMKSVSKLRGNHSQTMYPQPEGQLGECMLKYGRDLGDDSVLGQALTEAGEGYKQLADMKYSLEDSVKQNFIEPLQQLQSKEIKEVNFHRKKVESRRLDYDCRKRKQIKDASLPEIEVQEAEQKFEESKQRAEAAMHNLIENEVDQVNQLTSFIEAEVNFHRNAAEILQGVCTSLQQKRDEASSRPRTQYFAKRMTSSRSTGSDKSGSYDSNYESYDHRGKSSMMSASVSSQGVSSGYGGDLLSLDEPMYSVVSKPSKTAAQPRAEALFDFEAENDGELGFREGDIIDIVSKVDENWYEGKLRGRTGLFPVTYVKVLVDLPY